MKIPENILVTGGAGYIGSHFAKLVASLGFKPVVLDNLLTGHRRFVRFGPFVETDLRDTETVYRALLDHQIHAVVHFAARSIVSESVAQPEEYRANNVDGMRSLLNAMAGANVARLVLSSSCAVYGEARSPKLAEDHALHPLSPYGETKLECERLAAAFAQGSAARAVACLRYFNVVGQDPEGEVWEDHRPEMHLVPNLLRALREESEFFLYGTQHETPDGTCIRDYVDVNDLARIHWQALEHLEARKTGVFISNVGSGRGYSVREVVEMAERLTGRRSRLVTRSARPGDAPMLVADDRFFRTWCSQPLRPLEDSLRSVIGASNKS